MNKKTKILQVAKYFPPDWGGIETVCYELSEGLDKEQFLVDVLCFKNKEIRNKEKALYNIFRTRVIFTLFSQPLSLEYLNTYRKIRNNYDVVLVHLPNLLAIITVLLFPTNKKIFLHWHSDVVKQKKLLFLYDFFIKRLIKKTSVVIAPTYNHLKYSRYKDEIASKFNIIPYFINERKLKPNELIMNRALEIRKFYQNKKIIFSVGRLVEYKGFSTLVDVGKMISNQYVILIAGSGPLNENLINKIDAEKLTNKVILLGEINNDDKSAYFLASHIYCFPSIDKAEMFGMVQLEAMYYGKPIISTDIEGSGAPLININKKTGLIVPVKDVRKISEAIDYISDNNDRYLEYSNNAKKTFHDKYEFKNVIKEYEKVFEKHC